mgnify:CR=1 FL=1
MELDDTSFLTNVTLFFCHVNFTAKNVPRRLTLTVTQIHRGEVDRRGFRVMLIWNVSDLL